MCIRDSSSSILVNQLNVDVPRVVFCPPGGLHVSAQWSTPNDVLVTPKRGRGIGREIGWGIGRSVGLCVSRSFWSSALLKTGCPVLELKRLLLGMGTDALYAASTSILAIYLQWLGAPTNVLNHIEAYIVETYVRPTKRHLTRAGPAIKRTGVESFLKSYLVNHCKLGYKNWKH